MGTSFPFFDIPSFEINNPKIHPIQRSIKFVNLLLRAPTSYDVTEITRR